MSAEYTEAELLVAKHEACHGAALWIIFGPDSVGTLTRVPEGRCLGATTLADLPGFRSAALNAADLAVAMLAPIVSGCDAAGCDHDIEQAYICAAAAYRHRPDHEKDIDLETWADSWVHGTSRARAEEFVDSARFVRVRDKLEAALDTCPTLDPRTVLSDDD